MATSASPSCALSSSTTFADAGKARARLQPTTPHCVSLPTLPPPPPARIRDARKSIGHCHQIARNVVPMATGDSLASGESSAEVATEVEVPEFVKTVQDAWDKLEDKYAVTSLGFAVLIAIVGSTGLISAVDRIPLVPGVLELVGIGYTGWFAYRNLVFKPDREALTSKIVCTYKDIIGSS